MTEQTLRTVLTADGSGFVGEVRQAKGELDKLNAAQGQGTAAAAGAARQASALNRVTAEGTRFLTQHRFAVQQAGFQVGDFAVQIASGQGAMRAFIQQGSQMLGVFGPMGAVLGAVVAVGGALATTFLNLGDDARGAADDADELSDRYQKLADIMSQLQGVALPTPEALFKSARFHVSEFEAEVARAEKRLRELEQRQATPLGATETLRLDDLGRLFTGEESEAIKEAREEVNKLKFDLTLAQAIAGEFGDRFSGSARDAKEALAFVRREDEKAAREAEREAQTKARATESIQDQINALQFEREQIGRTARERFVHTELLRAETVARKGTIKLGDDQIDTIEREAGALFDLDEARRKADETERERLRGLEESNRQAQRAAQEFADRHAAPFADARPDIRDAMTARFSEALA